MASTMLGRSSAFLLVWVLLHAARFTIVTSFVQPSSLVAEVRYTLAPNNGGRSSSTSLLARRKRNDQERHNRDKHNEKISRKGENSRVQSVEEELVPGIPNASLERMREVLPPSTFEKWISITKVSGTSLAVDLLKEVVAETPGGVVHPDLFHALFGFSLDGFQLEALTALGQRKNAIVSAPTGSGKTVAGELAIYYALALGLRVFYTSPLKALSNQKYQDFRRQFGAERAGLLTGDTSINRGAQVCVMTTEVFRNMLYEEEDLLDVFAVVFDEFHYMNDPSRGTVWEESVIQCPPHMLMVALSATMRNVAEIAGWFQAVHGPTRLITSDFRPVPLGYFYATSEGVRPLFRNPLVGPGAPLGVIKRGKRRRRTKEDHKARARVGKRTEREDRDPMEINPEVLQNKRSRPIITENMSPREIRRAERAALSREVPSAAFLARRLARLDMLPAIVFIFSRVGCDRSVQEVVGAERGSGVLLTAGERTLVEERIRGFRAAYPDIPVDPDRLEGLRNGVAAHHAGLLPAYKGLIEDLFNAGAVKVLFATETLAAGVNMPARATVISVLSKRGDNGIETLKVSNLLQMAGRAGRRGKDIKGSVVLVRSRFETPQDAHNLLLSPIDSIRSNFRAGYGLVVNVLRTRPLDKARAMVRRSFGSYLASAGNQHRELEDVEEELQEIERSLAGLDLNQVRAYRKLAGRAASEARIERYLLNQAQDQERDLVEAVLPYCQLGTGLLLRSGESAALAGDRPPSFRAAAGEDRGDPERTVLVLTRGGELKVVAFDAVRLYDVAAEAGRPAGLPVEKARGLQLMRVAAWEPEAAAAGEGGGGVWRGVLAPGEGGDGAAAELRALGATIPEVPAPPVPAHLAQQAAVRERAEAELARNPLHARPDRDQILDWSADMEKLEERLKKANAALRNKDGEDPAWAEFMAVRQVLQQYEAIREDGTVTKFGKLVGAVNAENELWVALVLTHPKISSLSALQLAGLVAAIITEYTRPDTFIAFGCSEEIEAACEELLLVAQKLVDAQVAQGLVDMPVRLDPTYSGLVESWVGGASWQELCGSCSLDQGDLCRILRRTHEVLRQILVLPGVSGELKDTARAAAEAIDRFPVADELSELVKAEGEEEEAAASDDDEDDTTGDNAAVTKGEESATAAASVNEL